MKVEDVMETLRDNAVPIDLSAPGEYHNQINLAAMVGTFLLAMPLEEMSRLAQDACSQSLLKFDGSTRELRKTREMIEVLASTKRQLQKIQTRYGE